MSEQRSDPLLRHAEHSIAVGSKSFAAAARLFDPATRRSAMLLYAWCRHCDDVIDGQQAGHDALPLPAEQARRRLADLQRQTREIYAGLPAQTPAFAALGDVAQRHGIPPDEAFDLLEGFAQDVAGQRYARPQDVLGYCYHVAGVVGLMMARVMGVRDPAVLDRACDLGLAMQLTNIARDIVEDARVGRCYLPQAWLDEFEVPAWGLAEPRYRPAVAAMAERLLAEAEPYYRSAQAGLAALPWRSAWAVATAALVYRRIGIKVQAAGVNAWDGRLATSHREKLGAILSGLWRSLTRRLCRAQARDGRLWQRPGGIAARHGARATDGASAR